jgi:hypothetical protein
MHCLVRKEVAPEPERHAAMTFSSGDVPRAIRVPAGWRVTTSRTDPDPRLITGLMRTYVASISYGFGLDGEHPGPNAGGGASTKLGDSAVVVFVELPWYPPDEPIRWDPPAGARLRQTRITRWHRDAQNPGWRFRERRLADDWRQRSSRRIALALAGRPIALDELP